MKKSETIEKLAEAYLADKNEEQRRAFWEKDENRRYSAIMAWKRRNELKEAGAANIPDIIRTIRSAVKEIGRLESLPEREAEKLLDEIDALRRNVTDFDSIRALREIRELEEQKARLEKRMQELRAKAFKEEISENNQY